MSGRARSRSSPKDGETISSAGFAGPRRSRTRVARVDAARPDPEAIKEAAGILSRGALVAFPTETVYGLGANLNDPQAIQELYAVKERPFGKQVTLLLPEPAEAQRLELEIPPAGRALMEAFWPGPLTLIFRRTAGSTLGLRCPDHAVALALLRAAGVPVAAPSANLSGRPAPRTAEEVLRDLEDRIDLILDAGPVPGGTASTVLDFSGEAPRFLRDGPIREKVRRFLDMQTRRRLVQKVPDPF